VASGCRSDERIDSPLTFLSISCIVPRHAALPSPNAGDHLTKPRMRFGSVCIALFAVRESTPNR